MQADKNVCYSCWELKLKHSRQKQLAFILTEFLGGLNNVSELVFKNRLAVTGRGRLSRKSVLVTEAIF